MATDKIHLDLSIQYVPANRTQTARRFIREDISDALGLIDDIGNLMTDAHLAEEDALRAALETARRALGEAMDAAKTPQPPAPLAPHGPQADESGR